MHTELVIHPKAAEEYAASYHWYAEKKDGLAEMYEIAVEKLITQITQHPEYYSYSRKPYREALVVNFPFVLVYKYNKISNKIFVVSIHHTKRSTKGKYRK